MSQELIDALTGTLFTADGSINLLTVAVLVILLICAVFVYGILTITGKTEKAKRWVEALPAVLQAIGDFIDRADTLHDTIKEDYKDLAEKTGDDPRLLWVIDRTEAYIRSTINVDVDLNWIIDQVEIMVKNRKK